MTRPTTGFLLFTAALAFAPGALCAEANTDTIILPKEAEVNVGDTSADPFSSGIGPTEQARETSNEQEPSI